MTADERKVLLDRIDAAWAQAPDIGLWRLGALLVASPGTPNETVIARFEGAIAGIVDRRRDRAKQARREAGAG